MGDNLSISIILCTRNRAQELKRALEALAQVIVPNGLEVELIVVDNASEDDTAAIVQAAGIQKMKIQYVFEPKSGKANALNTGLARSKGEIILFTDDDAIVAKDWLEQITKPLLSDNCYVVTGLIKLAPHLFRTWMRPKQKWFLASSEDAQLHNGNHELIGANMGFRRSVLKRVPRFDPELGPGACGLGEDTLFGWQLVEAGFKIEYVPKAVVIHDLDVSRLRRFYWIDGARQRGRSQAYIAYHWEQQEVKNPRLTRIYYLIKLLLGRFFLPLPKLHDEGCPQWEMGCVWNIEFCKQFCLDRKSPRKYTRRGLVKREIS